MADLAKTVRETLDGAKKRSVRAGWEEIVEERQGVRITRWEKIPESATLGAAPVAGVQAHLWDSEMGYDSYDYKRGGWSGGSGSTGYVPRPAPGKVRVVDGNGLCILTKEVSGWSDDWWDIAKTIYPVDGKQLMTIPVANIRLREGDVSFFPCVYDAAKEYAGSLLGVILHESDRSWLARHPYAQASGIPQEYTATALQALFEPYGLQVSRVRWRAGTLAEHPEMHLWTLALGCNPMAMMDHRTTNEEAAQLLGVPLEVANQQFRLDFGDEPLQPSIIGERGWSSGAGVSTGGGGHSRYLAPRGRSGDWVISVQLVRAPVRYLVAPALPEYVARRGDMDFTLGDVMAPDGKPVAVLQGSKYVRPSELAVPMGAVVPAGGKTVTPLYTPKAVTDDNTVIDEFGEEEEADYFTCRLCAETVGEDELEPGTQVCQNCAMALWDRYHCPECKGEFSEIGNPEYADFDPKDGPLFACPVCGLQMTVPEGDTPDERDSWGTFEVAVELARMAEDRVPGDGGVL